MRYSELIENLEASDDDLFGEAPPARDSDKAKMMFKMKFNSIRRIPDNLGRIVGYMQRMYDLEHDARSSFGNSISRHVYWSMNVYTSPDGSIGAMHEEDSGGGSFTYIGARSKEALDQVLQELYDTGTAESPDAKKARIAAARQRKLDAAAKKGLKVGAQVRIPYFGGEEVIGTVTKISPAGKITLQYINPGLPGRGPIEHTTTAHGIRKADVVGESEEPSDNDLFGESSHMRVGKALEAYADQMIKTPEFLASFDKGDPEYDADIEDIETQGYDLKKVSYVFARQGMEAGLHSFADLADPEWWWDVIVPEVIQKTGIDLAELYDEMQG